MLFLQLDKSQYLVSLGSHLGRWEKGVGSVGMLAHDSMSFAHLHQRGA